MPQQWTWPAYVGVFGGALLFAVFFLPIVLVQSRRYGRLSGRRLLVSAGLAVYGVALVAYTLLPLPSGAAGWCAQHGIDAAQLRPLAFVDDIRRETAGLGLSQTLRSRSVLQVVFNVLLFVPWGVAVRRFFDRGVLVTVVSGFAVSVLVEVTQYTGVFGLVGCSYRIADVDDVLTNTLGAAVGALVAPLVLVWLPRSADLVRERGRPRRVTVWRRWTGMAVDWFLFAAVPLVLVLAYRAGLLAFGHPLPDGDVLSDVVLGTAVPGLLVFVLPAFTRSGASFGQRALWLRPAWPERGRSARASGRSRLGDGTLAQRLGRACVTGGAYAALSTVEVVDALPDAVQDLAGTASLLVLLVAFFGVLATEGRRGVSFALSGATLVDSRAVASGERADVRKV